MKSVILQGPLYFYKENTGHGHGEKYYTTINPSPEVIRTHNLEFFI